MLASRKFFLAGSSASDLRDFMSKVGSNASKDGQNLRFPTVDQKLSKLRLNWKKNGLDSDDLRLSLDLQVFLELNYLCLK